MSVRFAAARDIARSPIARVLNRGEIELAANDHDELEGFMSETTVAALRHFGEFGLRAVEVAAHNAQVAAAAHETEDYRHWLGICRALDRQAAQRVEASLMTEDERLIG
ncbi:hypothetical protein K3152_02830 [Qipengyuania sp. 1NDH17]|uniref:Uncharacterized protein n=1 Tax=Qipengyuania polymorpha TaxID=2867234 RepID=A0ABS7IUT2_9SPHN|nr:hypothetical protein [Qipengyuania polymorpha]MBX7457171.1 hypothetical protein [Qipengyuania polymorpha]